jgi:hypothetical protein
MDIKYDKGVVTISFPYKADGNYPASSTGKMLNVATSHGFVSVPGTDLKVSLNAGKANPSYAKASK